MRKPVLLLLLILPAILPAQFLSADFLPAACEADYLRQQQLQMDFISHQHIHSLKIYIMKLSGDSAPGLPDSTLTEEVIYDEQGRISSDYEKSFRRTDARIYSIDSSSGKITGYRIVSNGRKDFFAVFQYDRDGNISGFGYYFPDSSLKERYEFTYDDQHRCVKEIRYEHDGAVRTGLLKYEKDAVTIDYSETNSPGWVVHHIEKYKLDKQGRIIECKTIYPKDKKPVYEYRYWDYSPKGFVSSFQLFDGDGKLKQKRDYVYNSAGLKTAMVFTNHAGESSTIYHYSWN